jgi:hypothetical protein
VVLLGKLVVLALDLLVGGVRLDFQYFVYAHV